MASHRAYRTHIILLAAVATLGGCGQFEDEERGRYIATNRPIINGTPDTSQAHMAVVALTYGPGSGSFCTGTLVSANVVVTAAHCLENVQTQWVQAFFGNDVTGSGDYRAVSEMQSHTTYNGGSMQGDIGLIRLSSNAPSSVTPIPPLPANMGLTSADVGTNVDFSGFGVTEFNSDGVKLHVQAPIGFVCNQGSTCQGYIAPFAFQYAQSSGGPCSGDSGGPAFIMRGGTEYLAGVTSYGDPNCQQYGVSTMVDPYISWINAFIGTTSEDCSNGVDDDGDGQADCADADCSLDAACQGPDACESAGSLTCGASVNDTTVGGTSTFDAYSCMNQGTEDGPERGYELAMSAGTQVTATMTPTGAGDLDLFLLPPAGAGCSPMSCLDGSLNGESEPETLTFTVPAGGAFLVVETYDTPSSYTLKVSCSGQAELCLNGADDDGDGDIDCADADCANDPACSGQGELCANGVDDDDDGHVDCDDADCANDPACGGVPEICDNGGDDDGDGAIDCADPECESHAYCLAGQELCTNGVDDDGDGAADCADPDCATAPSCQPVTRLTKGGCNCQQSNPASAPMLPALALLLLLGLLRRRR